MRAIELIDQGAILDDLPAYFTYRPRPDQPDRYDEQTAFYESRLPGLALHIGGNGSGTTENTLAKVAKFVLRDQAPPRYDTPFWVIAGSYEQVMESCWKEKLWGHGHIPEAEVDWERVSWKSRKDAWPFRVPLRPWPNRPGKNWVLEFKSYTQGRQQMQARSLGGFAFVEQFPYSILTEVMRGCREYNFPGSKFAEFTPIDPDLSYEIQLMIEEDRLPPGWDVFRANTACNLEAGYVSQEWYDEFFGMVSADMQRVRQIGEFAGYEGQIYQDWNPRVHVVDDDVITFPPGVHHRRAIDWGSGPDNAFVCLWAYFDGSGRWYVYDEYYTTEPQIIADKLVEVSTRWPWPSGNPLYGMTYADPSGTDHIRVAGKLNNFYPHADSIPIAPAANSVLEGIDYVQWLLQPHESLDNQPRLFIHGKNCPNLSREMRTYRWQHHAELNGANASAARMMPVKRDDHAVDALRYLVFTESALQNKKQITSERRQTRKSRMQFQRNPR